MNAHLLNKSACTLSRFSLLLERSQSIEINKYFTNRHLETRMLILVNNRAVQGRGKKGVFWSSLTVLLRD